MQESSMFAQVSWRKSNLSGDGNCVEVAAVPGVAVGVRDSKDALGTPLVFAPTQWAAFVAEVKAGQFDLR